MLSLYAKTVAKTVANGKIKYQFDIYARADNDTREGWCRLITNSRDRLKNQFNKYKSCINTRTDTFRAKDFFVDQYCVCSSESDEHDSGFLYVTAQPLWPLKFSFGSALRGNNASRIKQD